MASSFVKIGILLALSAIIVNCHPIFSAQTRATSSVYSTMYKRVADTRSRVFSVLPISHYYYTINHGPYTKRSRIRPVEKQPVSQPHSRRKYQGICYFPLTGKKLQSTSTCSNILIFEHQLPSFNYPQTSIVFDIRGYPRPSNMPMNPNGSSIIFLPDPDVQIQSLPMKKPSTTTQKPNATESEENSDFYLGTVSSQRRRCPGGQKPQRGKCRTKFTG